MTLHLHTEHHDWCFRCRLSRDEAEYLASLPECRDDCEDFACHGECNTPTEHRTVGSDDA